MRSIIFKLFWITFGLIISCSTFATTINIPGDFSTIQQGINAVQNGDTILVESGTYYENINFRGKNIVVGSRYVIDKNISHILNTIIDGSMYSTIDSASCVAFVSGEDSTAVIQGFTVTGGKGTTYDLRNINPNWQVYTQEGGGVFLDQSSATIKNNLIINNEASRRTGYDFSGGGGISSFVGNPHIYNNVIMSNDAGYACGVVLNWSGGIIKNNLIYGNYGGEIEGAGGIMIWDNGPAPQIVENNTIVNNISDLNAGGIFNYNTASVIRNNIIWGNQQQSGQQVVGYQSSVFEYCNTEETYPGTGNISVNPDFDSTNFQLNPGSACIDAGNPGIIYNDVEDPTNTGFAMFPSFGTLRNDIGAYGGPGATILLNISSIVGISENRNSKIPNSVGLYQNYPNPFNPVTKIQFSTKKAGSVKIEVINLLGAHIQTLFDGHIKSGMHEVDFNAHDLPSGVYYYRIKTKEYSETKKMLLVQ